MSFFRIRLTEIQDYLATQKKISIKINRNIDEKKYYYFFEAEINGENIYTEISKANAIKNDLFDSLDSDVITSLNILLFLQLDYMLNLINKI